MARPVAAVDPAIPALILLPSSFCLLFAAALAWLEYRRPDRRRRLARLTATLAAAAALACLALLPSPLAAPAVPATAVLLTPGATPFPLPPSSFVIRPSSFVIPPPSSLHIYGDGLDPAELPAPAGQHVVFHPPTPAAAHPAIAFLCCPRELPLGEPLELRGRVTNLAPSQTARLTLTAPDGALAETLTAPADAGGSAAFALSSPALPAPGRYLWQLQLNDPPSNPQPPSPSSFVVRHLPAAVSQARLSFPPLPLGVSILPPALPRVLILEGAPQFDTAALRRWYGASGGALLVRTQLGRDRFRSAAAQGTPPPPFPGLDAPRLAGFDLVLADAPALLALRPEERAALLAAVHDPGLGLLVLADETLLRPPPNLAPLFPWTLLPAADAPPFSPPPSSFIIRHSSFPAAFCVLPTASDIPLAADSQGRLLAAAARAGRGQLALTLVQDTARWTREGDPAAFAGYWSHLFTRLARPAEPAGHWTLLDGDAGPVFTDHPLTLRWTGPADRAPATALVTSDTDPAPPTALALASDPLEPAARLGTFWPRRAGWHRADADAAPGSPGLDFYVHPAADWPALDAARRRTATARFAELSAASPAAKALLSNRALSPAWAVALFFLCAGYLWAERRLASEEKSKVQSTGSKAQGPRSKPESVASGFVP